MENCKPKNRAATLKIMQSRIASLCNTESSAGGSMWFFLAEFASSFHTLGDCSE